MTWLDAHLADLALPLLLLIVGAVLVAVTAIAEHVARYRSLFRHARRCEAAREQMRRELGGAR